MFGKTASEAKKTDISKLAHISTLTEEELVEADNGPDSENVEDTDEQKTVADYMPGTKASAEDKKPVRIDHTQPCFKAASKPDRKTMFDFMMYHSYASVPGILSILIGIGAIAMVVVGLINKSDTLQIVLFAAVAVMFVANSPVTLWFKAKKQSKLICSEMNTITYTFSDAGFDMSRGDDEYADFEWSHMYKVKESENAFYMYLEKNRAFVVPKNDIDGSIDEFKELLKRRVEKRLKFIDENRA